MYDDALSPLAGIVMIVCFSHMLFLPFALVMSLCNGLLAWKLGYAKKQCWLAAAYPLFLPLAVVVLVMLMPEVSGLLYIAVLLLMAYGYCRKFLIHPDPTRLRIYFPISAAVSVTVWLLSNWLLL